MPRSSDSPGTFLVQLKGQASLTLEPVMQLVQNLCLPRAYYFSDILPNMQQAISKGQ